MSTDDLVRNIERIPQLARELRELHERLDVLDLAGYYPVDRVLTASEFLTEIHQFIVSVPEVMQRAKVAALFDAYQDIALALRERALDIGTGKRGPMRPGSALLQMAEAIEKSAAEHRRLLHGDESPERPKPKLVIN